MDQIAIASGVAILVVLVLLSSCWNVDGGRRRRRKQMSCPRDGYDSGSDDNDDNNDADVSGQFFSDTGSGLMNRQLMKQYNELANVDSYEGYEDVTKFEALEPEVFDSQSSYVKDSNRATSGASTMTVRSDSQDINPRVGLRLTDYHSVYAAADARTEHTEAPDQMYSQTRYLI